MVMVILYKFRPTGFYPIIYISDIHFIGYETVPTFAGIGVDSLNDLTHYRMAIEDRDI